MGSTADRIKDIGPQPQSFTLNARRGKHKLPFSRLERALPASDADVDPRCGDIGLEAHPETDQFLRLDAGSGRVQMGAAKDKLTFEKEVSDGWCVLVPAGTWHNITISGATPMQVYAIYAPATTRPTRCRRRRRRPKPTKTTSQRLVSAAKYAPDNTGDQFASARTGACQGLCERSTGRAAAKGRVSSVDRKTLTRMRWHIRKTPIGAPITIAHHWRIGVEPRRNGCSRSGPWSKWHSRHVVEARRRRTQCSYRAINGSLR